MEFNSYGIKFIFDEKKNKKIGNYNWFVDVLKKQNWEPVTFKMFKEVSNPEKVAIDIGSWIGPTTIFLSKYFKKVISIEADIVSFESLTSNIEDNECKNVTLINKAFYNSEEDKIYFGVNSHKFDPVLGSSTSQSKKQSDDINDYSIDTISIFDLLKIVEPTDIEFLKVDIEGGDEDIFEEIITVGSNYGWKIWLSFHYGWWKNKDVSRFTHILKFIKKVRMDEIEIPVESILSKI